MTLPSTLLTVHIATLILMHFRPASFWCIPVAALVIAAGCNVTPRQAGRAAEDSATPAIHIPTKPLAAKQSAFRVIRSYPHDPQAFTQGLLWHEGSLYEGTGRKGFSTLRRVELATGRVLRVRKLPPDVFGEGIAVAGDKIVQLSWQSQRAFVFDLKTFTPLGEWKYSGEGWGLTYDGRHLVMSDGSDALTFRDPETFAEVKKINVSFNGKPLRDLNELEWINGQIWANVWKTDSIVRINPVTGVVEAYLDCSGLLSGQSRRGGEDVLNGIAYDEQNKRIFLTGKLWPRLFEIKLIE